MSKKFIVTTLVCLFMFGAMYDISIASTYENSQQGTEQQTADVIYDNENWFTHPHPEPYSFIFTEDGEIYGTTTTGIAFSQINIENEAGVRVQKFIIQNHYHYVLANRIAYTDTDLDAAILDIVNKK